MQKYWKFWDIYIYIYIYYKLTNYIIQLWPDITGDSIDTVQRCERTKEVNSTIIVKIIRIIRIRN